MSSPGEATSSPGGAARRPGGRRLTMLYVAALSTVALLSLGAQGLIQRQLQVGASDSRVINVAGRQRMLSQRIAKCALQLRDEPSEERSRVRAELASSLGEWAASHDALQHGDAELNLPGRISPEVAELFRRVEPHYDAIRSAADALVTSELPFDAVEGRVQEILDHEADFLAGMDAIVSQHVVEAEGRVEGLRRLEYAILASTLLVLLVEGLWVFRPAVRGIELAVRRLESMSQRLRRAKNQAEEANAAKTRFLANVSHELRTPMTAVLGMNELARSAGSQQERDRRLADVQEAGKSLLGLLNDLIDFASIDADQLKVDSLPMQVTAPSSRATRVLGASAEAKGVRLYEKPHEDSAPFVLGDEERLVQVLLNLVANAVKWTDSGEVSVGCVWRRLADGLIEVEYQVADTGAGIPAEEQGRVFEAFVQAERESGGGRGGVGLGLAICKRMIDAMGGSIQLESEPGRGTTVTVRLTTPEADKSPSEGAERPQVAGRPLHVLVVEDTELNQRFLGAALQNAGHRATIVGTGHAACAQAQHERFDAALIDLGLPDINGEQVAAQLRAQAKETGGEAPALLCLTAHADAESKSRVADAFDAVLTKPIRIATLLQELARWTGEQTASVVSADSPDSFAQELGDAFLQIAADELADLDTAVDSGDLPRVAVVAHRLSGQVAYFDGEAARQLLVDLEKAANAGDTQRVASMTLEVRGAITLLIERLAGEASQPSTR